MLAAQRLVVAYSRALVAQAEKNPDLLVLDADLVKDCGLIEFRDRFPERFVECGIAEQDMVSTACGMAHRGALPVVPLLCLLSVGASQRADRQPGERILARDLRRFAGGPAAGRAWTFASIGARYLGRGAIPHLMAAEPCTEREVELLVDFLFNAAGDSDVGSRAGRCRSSCPAITT